jgi:SAM-dependent methyltransferase
MGNPDKGLDLGLEAKRLKNKINKYARKAGNEEELKIKVEGLIQEIIAKFFPEGEEPEVVYEHRTKISGKRKDALYGTVIIEYKAPKRLDTGSEFVKAKEQVVEYIKEEAGGAAENFGKFFGVILDGYKISFVKFRRNEWVANEPTEVSEESVYRLLEAIISLRRKAIDADFLLADFGPESETSEKVIAILYAALEKSTSSRTAMLFKDWKRVFSQVCAYSPSKLEGLIEHYGIAKGKKKVDVEMLMFAVHTYYTLVMKLLTSEGISYFNPVFGSPLQRIENAYYRSRDELKEELLDLEEGGIIAKIGIRNFLEADYFAWYLDEWNEEVVKGVIDIVSKLSDYDPATVELDPDRVKDLFKRLYQNLVPKQVRHDLGEYFTPDWLAELVLKEVEYDGNVDKRVLDPACGSGTFLVLAIKEAKNYAEEHFITDKRELLRKIVGDVVGIDLNPLAVLASRANYVIALGDLIRYIPKDGVEIPVYLADSILVSRKVKFSGELVVYLTTSEGEFSIPHEVIDKNLLPNVLGEIETCVKGDYSESEFEELIKKDFTDLKEGSRTSLTELYNKIKGLEKEGKNRIWTRLLKNSFAPLLMGEFDFVVGNPPWVRWGYLPEGYRDATLQLWKDYKLFSLSGMEARLGSGEKDLSMLFTYVAAHRYLKKGEKLAFLITQEVFKAKGAGEGFRGFKARGTPLKVLKAHDLVSLKPFESAANKTALIVLKKGEKTVYPVPYILWRKKKGARIDTGIPYEEVLDRTERIEMQAKPIGKSVSSWQTFEAKSESLLDALRGKSIYKSRRGASIEPYGVFYMKIKQVFADGTILVENLPELGKRKISKVEERIESDLVFPAVRGRDIKRWNAEPEVCALIVQDPKKRVGYEEEWMRVNLPRTFGYLYKFKGVLLSRGSNVVRELAEKTTFYTMYGIGEYTFAPYKVV